MKLLALLSVCLLGILGCSRGSVTPPPKSDAVVAVQSMAGNEVSIQEVVVKGHKYILATYFNSISICPAKESE